MSKLYGTRAFTLVELSIVLVIIGLIIGGILVGQDMVKQARVHYAVKQMGEILSAHNAYRLKYGAIPGDDPNAANNLAGATGGGDGNGIIFSTASYCCGQNLSSWPKLNATTDTEVSWYWQHLQLAGLFSFSYVANSANISDNFPESRLVPNSYVFISSVTGSAYLSGALSGATHVYFLNTNNGGTGSRMQYIVPGLFNATFTGRQADATSASGFDTKLDDGKPSTGRVRVLAGCAYGQTAYDFVTTPCDASMIYRAD